MNTQTWNSKTYEENARFVSDLGIPVVELLDPKPGEKILDVGCGDGVLTKKLKDIGCRVLGVDASEGFIQSAKKNGIEAYVINAYKIQYSLEFDAVFSNAALHWMKNADLVIENIYRSLRHGGRFVAECGGFGCVETIKSALIKQLNDTGYDGEAACPWYFPDTKDYASKLENAGFEVDYIELIPRPTPLPGDVLGWLETFALGFTALLPEHERRDFLLSVRDAIKPKLCGSSGQWVADYI